MDKQAVVVVLAAGRGSRFGGPSHKLTQPLLAVAARGGPPATDATHDAPAAARLPAASVLQTTLKRVIESGLPMVVVTTSALSGEAAGLVAQRDVMVLSAAAAQRGMAHSIAAGVSARSDAPGWLILPADMPLVRPASLRAVAAALPGHAAVVPHHGGRRGHPVAFSAELFSELLALTGDEGARRLLLRYPSVALELPDPGVLIDIDTPSDLAAARSALERAQSLP